MSQISNNNAWTSGNALPRTSDDWECLALDLGRQERPRLGPRTTGSTSSRTSNDADCLALDLGRRERPRPRPQATGEVLSRTSDDWGDFFLDLGRRGIPRPGSRTTGEANFIERDTLIKLSVEKEDRQSSGITGCLGSAANTTTSGLLSLKRNKLCSVHRAQLGEATQRSTNYWQG